MTKRSLIVTFRLRPIATMWQRETVAGDYWIVKEGEDNWPVVVCDDEIIEEFFETKQRPRSARQGDANWLPEYKSRGAQVNERSFPVSYLGTTQYAWIPCHLLKTFDETLAIPILSATNPRINPDLVRSWKTALCCDQGSNDWKETLYKIRDNKVKLRLREEAPPSSKILQLRKRMEPSTGFPLRSTYKARHTLNDESEGEDAPAPYKAEVKQEHSLSKLNIPQSPERNGSVGKEPVSKMLTPKKEPQVSNLIDLDDLHDGFTAQGTETRRNKRAKVDRHGRSFSEPGAPDGRNIGESLTIPIRKTPGTDTVEARKITDIIPSETNLSIYVGTPQISIKIPMSGVKKSPFLMNLLAYNADTGWYIMSPTLNTLTWVDFKPVQEFLESGDYQPTMNTLTETQPDQVHRPQTYYAKLQVKRCVSIYKHALKLQLPQLQELVFTKLKFLLPYRSADVLAVADDIFCSGTPEIREWLIQYVAEHFLEVIRVKGFALADTFERNKALSNAVLKRVGDLAT